MFTDTLSDYEDLASYVIDAIDNIGDSVSVNTEGLSQEELSWINKIKNM